MIQARMTGARADAHRQDLLMSADTHRRARSRTPEGRQTLPTHRSASGFPVAGGRAVGRSLTSRVGDWLISAGTRLGGAPMRTST
jgi:hypothetical protein